MKFFITLITDSCKILLYALASSESNVVDTALGIVLGVTVLAGLAFLAIPLVQKLGLFSYVGLTRQQVMRVYHELDSRCKILSRVCGSNKPGHRFCRGVYLGGDATFPLYYRYEYWPSGKAEFSLYPMLMEKWSTDADLFNLTGRSVYPLPPQNRPI